MKITDKTSNLVRFDCMSNCDEDFGKADTKSLEDKEFLTNKLGQTVLDARWVFSIVCKKQCFFPLTFSDVLKFSDLFSQKVDID